MNTKEIITRAEQKAAEAAAKAEIARQAAAEAEQAAREAEQAARQAAEAQESEKTEQPKQTPAEWAAAEERTEAEEAAKVVFEWMRAANKTTEAKEEYEYAVDSYNYYASDLTEASKECELEAAERYCPELETLREATAGAEAIEEAIGEWRCAQESWDEAEEAISDYSEQEAKEAAEKNGWDFEQTQEAYRLLKSRLKENAENLL